MTPGSSSPQMDAPATARYLRSSWTHRSTVPRHIYSHRLVDCRTDYTFQRRIVSNRSSSHHRHYRKSFMYYSLCGGQWRCTLSAGPDINSVILSQHWSSSNKRIQKQKVHYYWLLVSVYSANFFLEITPDPPECLPQRTFVECCCETFSDCLPFMSVNRSSFKPTAFRRLLQPLLNPKTDCITDCCFLLTICVFLHFYLCF